MKEDKIGLRYWSHQISRHKPNELFGDRAARILLWLFLGWLVGISTITWLLDVVRGVN